MGDYRSSVQYQDLAEPILGPINPTGGGRGQPAYNRNIIQYQDLGEPVTPPASVSLSAANVLDTTMVLEGMALDYQAFAFPVAVPPPVPVVDPQGAAYLAQYPLYVLRRGGVLPEQGTFALPVLTPLVGGSALSWMPVYERRGLRYWWPQQQDHTDPSIWNVPISVVAPPGTAAYAAQYPGYQLRRAPQPNVGPVLTWTAIPIVPAPPPVGKTRVDLRRRQQLGVRRLIR